MNFLIHWPSDAAHIFLVYIVCLFVFSVGVVGQPPPYQPHVSLYRTQSNGIYSSVCLTLDTFMWPV